MQTENNQLASYFHFSSAAPVQRERERVYARTPIKAVRAGLQHIHGGPSILGFYQHPDSESTAQCLFIDLTIISGPQLTARNQPT